MQAVQVVQWLSILLIVTSKACLVYFIFRQRSKTFLDWLVFIDSCLGFNQCFTVLVVGSRIRSLLNVGIVIYRFVSVVCW